MKKVFIVHGYGGKPNGGWRPWLMGKLARQDVYACALPMPNPSNPTKEEWVKIISDTIGNPTEEIFLIGHSLGVPAILLYLEKLNNGSRIGGAVLVSGPIRRRLKPEYNEVDKFFDNAINFERIKKTCKNFIIIHGDNDPIVSYSEGEELAGELSCDLIPIPNGRHLNGSDGFYELPEAFESLLKMING